MDSIVAWNPDLGRWAAIDDPTERLRAALEELYAHYRRTERMMDNILRGEATVPVVKRMLVAAAAAGPGNR